MSRLSTDSRKSTPRRSRRDRSHELSCSIHGLTQLEVSDDSEDEIPVRDTGLGVVVDVNSESQLSVLEAGDSLHSLPHSTGAEYSDFRKRHMSRNNNSIDVAPGKARRESQQKAGEDPQTKSSEEGHYHSSTWDTGKPLELIITPQNIDTLLISARFYKKRDVIAMCMDQLMNCTVESALYYKYVAEKHELTDVIPFLLDYVRANFTSVVETHSFLGMGLDQLKTLLADDGLKVNGELEVYLAARAWIHHNEGERLKYIDDVMECVRFMHILPQDILLHVEPDSQYIQGVCGRKVLLNVYRYHALINSNYDFSSYKVNIPPRRCYQPLTREKPSKSTTLRPKVSVDQAARKEFDFQDKEEVQHPGHLVKRQQPHDHYQQMNNQSPTQFQNQLQYRVQQLQLQQQQQQQEQQEQQEEQQQQQRQQQRQHHQQQERQQQRQQQEQEQQQKQYQQQQQQQQQQHQQLQQEHHHHHLQQNQQQDQQQQCPRQQRIRGMSVEISSRYLTASGQSQMHSSSSTDHPQQRRQHVRSRSEPPAAARHCWQFLDAESNVSAYSVHSECSEPRASDKTANNVQRASQGPGTALGASSNLAWIQQANACYPHPQQQHHHHHQQQQQQQQQPPPPPPPRELRWHPECTFPGGGPSCPPSQPAPHDQSHFQPGLENCLQQQPSSSGAEPRQPWKGRGDNYNAKHRVHLSGSERPDCMEACQTAQYTVRDPGTKQDRHQDTKELFRRELSRQYNALPPDDQLHRELYSQESLSTDDISGRRHHRYSSKYQLQSTGEIENCTLLAIGGLNPYQVDADLPTRLVERYDPKTNVWSLLTKLPEPRHHHACVMLEGFLYLIGGSVLNRKDVYDMANPTNSCYRYDVEGNYWTAIAPMRSPRMYHAVAVLKGVIYAVGGQTYDEKFLNTVEYYNPDCDSWGHVASLLDPTIGVAALGFKNYLYVIGGFLELDDESIVLGSVECFDPRRNRWISRRPLPSPRCHASAVEVFGRMYLVGGSTLVDEAEAVQSLASVLRYNEWDDEWETFERMQKPRHDIGCAVLGNRIYILGGVCSLSKMALQDVECLDVARGLWLHDLEPLSMPTIGLASVGLDDVSFM